MKGFRLCESHELADIAARYESQERFFPLIMAVLTNRQEGLVYTHNNSNNFFIVHKFGFADLIETNESDEFDAVLLDFLMRGQFKCEKMRWYQVPKRWISTLSLQDSNQVAIVERTEFMRTSLVLSECDDAFNYSIKGIGDDNFDEVDSESGLSLAGRFWPSRATFIKNSFGLVAYKEDVVVAVCYACAVEKNLAEIDVFTMPRFRGLGLGRIVVAEFIKKCKQINVIPHWDCYTNNLPSIRLAKSLDFKINSTYQHAIISKIPI